MNPSSFETNKYSIRSLIVELWIVSQSIANNTTTVGWRLKGNSTSGSWYTLRNTYLNLNGTRVYTQPSGYIQLDENTVVASGTTVVSHNSDGTKSMAVLVACDIYYNSGYHNQVSGTSTITAIPRQATLLTAQNFNDEANPVITYSNPAGNSVTSLDACISLTGASADVPYRALTKTGSSYTFNLTEEERNTLRNATTTSNSRTVKFVVRTVISGTTFYSTLDKTLTIVNANPTFTTFVWKPSDDFTKNVLDWTSDISTDNGKTVAGITKYTITCTSATALKGATITGYRAVINGNTTNSATTTINTTKAISANDNLVVSAIDSRGNLTSVTKAITTLPYAIPTLSNPELIRKSFPNNETATLSFNGKLAQLLKDYGTKNTDYSLTYSYKKTTDSSYTSGTALTYTVGTDGSIVFSDDLAETFDKDYSYNIKVVLYDTNTTTYLNLILPTDIPLLSRRKGQIGINKVPEDGALDVSGDIYVNGMSLLDMFYPIGTIYETTSTDLNTTTKMANHFGGTWEVYGSGAVTVCKSADTEFDTIGETGGAKTVTLTSAQSGLPAHGHTGNDASFYIRHGSTSGTDMVAEGTNTTISEGVGETWSNGVSVASYSHAIDRVNIDITVNNNTASNASSSHTNLQPYIVVYRYRRTA